MHPLALFAGMLWTLPNTVLGLLLGLAGMPWGARAHWSGQELALVFNHWPWGPGGAMTLGNVIVNKGRDLDARCHTYAHRAGQCVEPLIRLGTHEHAHVRQYMLLGPLFLPLYFALGGVAARNPLEKAADHYALHGKGWWPFGHRG